MPNDEIPAPERPARLLRLPVVMDRAGLGRSTIYRRMADGTFPRSVDNGSGARWREADIEAWTKALPYRAER